MDVLIAGDLFVSDRYRGTSFWDPSIRSLFAGAGLRVVNLEAPVTAGARKQRIFKTGPHISAAKETVLPLLSELGIDLVTLANNHVMDYGTAGLAETLASLGSAGIRAVGAGPGLAGAAEPFVFESDGARVAILNFAENEWASAEPGRAGANPLDPVANVHQIRAARKTCDAAIVVIHGGQEDFYYPTPRMVKLYRFFAENGASAIVGHHTHCVSGYEVHLGTPIFYSLGNFLFTEPGRSDRWRNGLVLKLRLEGGRVAGWELIPVAQDPDDFAVTRLEGEAREAAMKEIEGFSRVIADEPSLLAKWEEFLKESGSRYIETFNPLNAVGSWWVRAALFRARLDRLFSRKGQYAEILDTIRCESHAEAARDSIRRLLEQHEDRDP